MQITNIHQTFTKEEFLKAINRDDFVEPGKGDAEIAASLQISEEAQKRFDLAVQPLERERLDMPEYCGIYQTDKAIATAVEGLNKEDRMFVYDTIRQNFLRENTSDLTEEERQANISLGMKKAEYAATNFIPEKQKQAFMTAMETIAKIASAGRADANGNMDYGLTKASYLGHGSNLVATTNTVDMMKHMDSAAYEEYQKIDAESSNEDRALNLARYMTNWYTKAMKDKPNMLAEYEKKNAVYLEKEIKNKELPTHFDNINVSSKETFLAGIGDFMSGHLGFMSDILWREMFHGYWRS